MLADNASIPVMILGPHKGERATLSNGFRVLSSAGGASLSEQINSLIGQESSPYALLVREEVILDAGLRTSIQPLIEDLNRDYHNWGICGATGVRWDGEKTYWYIRRPPRNPETGVCARPVISVGSEVLLLNLQQLRAEKCTLGEPTENWWEIGPLFALECLRRLLCVLVDRRLMVVDTGKEPDYKQDGAIQQMMRGHFVNHRLHVPWGKVEISNVAYAEFLRLPPVQHEKLDIVSCYDAALARARKKRPLSLTIACRSHFNRPHLLERAFLSFATAQEESSEACELRVALVSDKSNETLQVEVNRWRERFPSLALTPLYVQSRSRETSRVDNLLHSIAGLETDYLWFVDDDDFVMPGAVAALARVLVPHAPLLCVGGAEVLEETWLAGTFVDFHKAGAHASKHVFDVFHGENFVPICSMVLPVKLARERCRAVEASGEYLEDYFILMRILTSPEIEVETIRAPISGISMRGTENTARDKHRRIWDRSYAQFVGELVRSGSVNPLLWQMVRR